MTLIHRRGLLALGGGAAAGALFAPSILRAQTLTVADTLAGDSRFRLFLDLITRATMVEDLRQPGPITLFAPIDAAFAGAPAALMQDLTGENQRGGQESETPRRDRLMALINYHIVQGAYGPAELQGADRRLRTRNGGDISVTQQGGQIVVENPAPGQQMGSFGAAGFQVSAVPAQIVQANIPASNGVVHAISQVLWP